MPSRQPPQSFGIGGGGHGVIFLILSGVFVLLFLMILVYVIRKLIYKRIATAPLDLPYRFSHSMLRRATSSFSESNRLGKGGVGSVFSGVLTDGRTVAVKVMDSGTLHCEREFRNEILLARGIDESDRVLSILGFATERKGKELVVVYELMKNGSLQDALLYRKCVELKKWKVRFGIALDVAEAIYFLHSVCNPPVIHCDIKASNVLLDCGFRAKLADFGLARLKCGNNGGYCQAVDVLEGMRCGSHRFDESLEGEFNGVSPDSLCRDLGTDVGVEAVVDSLPVETVIAECGSYEKPKRLPREWWKEEFSAELTNKTVKKKQGFDDASCVGNGEETPCSQTDHNSVVKDTMKKNMAIIDWCNHKLISFNILKKQRNIRAYGDPHPPKSRYVSSTPSMKGTVCYTAPEFSCAGNLSEKCDIYSFGVLLLVLISGRRPLEMTSSPMKDFERANLVTWARQLDLDDKLLDLVDPDIKLLDKEQAMRCLAVALLCLQRSPDKRPSAKEIIQMLSHSSNQPELLLQCSPSPPQ